MNILYVVWELELLDVLIVSEYYLHIKKEVHMINIKIDDLRVYFLS